MRVLKIAFTLLCFLMIAVGCGRKTGETKKPSRGAICAVGSDTLFEGDLKYLLLEGNGMVPGLEEKKRYIDRWVTTEILYQEALKRGVASDPRIRARLNELEHQFLADHMLFLALRERIKVTEEEIRRYFKEHEKEYMYEYRVSHILVNTLEEAQKVKELLKKRSFAWVANRYSVDPMARRGGDLGYLTKGNMIPEFEAVVFKMKPGEVSDIVKSDFGYHIIKLVGMRKALARVTLDDVREQIMNELLVEKRKKAFSELMDSLRTVYPVSFFNDSYMSEEVGSAGTSSEDSI